MLNSAITETVLFSKKWHIQWTIWIWIIYVICIYLRIMVSITLFMSDVLFNSNTISATCVQELLTNRPTERESQTGRRPGAHEFRGNFSCFLNHNSSIHFCCNDSLLMTHRGGLSLSIIIWRIGGGGGAIFLLPWGPTSFLVALFTTVQQLCPHSSFSLFMLLYL
jgi:hypothetical protein